MSVGHEWIGHLYDMNVLPLGSCDVLIEMDWLESQMVNLDYYINTFACMDEEGNPIVVRGIPKVISVRQIPAMQLKKFCRKGCRVYAAHVFETAENETIRLEDYPVLQEFEDVFLILGLPPRRDIEFTIELGPGAA